MRDGAVCYGLPGRGSMLALIRPARGGGARRKLTNVMPNDVTVNKLDVLSSFFYKARRGVTKFNTSAILT